MTLQQLYQYAQGNLAFPGGFSTAQGMNVASCAAGQPLFTGTAAAAAAAYQFSQAQNQGYNLVNEGAHQTAFNSPQRMYPQQMAANQASLSEPRDGACGDDYSQSLSPEHLRQHVNELFDWVGSIQGNIDTINDGVGRNDESCGIEVLRGEMETYEAGTRECRGEVEVLRLGMETYKREMNALKLEMEEHRRKGEVFKGEMEEFRGGESKRHRSETEALRQEVEMLKKDAAAASELSGKSSEKTCAEVAKALDSLGVEQRKMADALSTHEEMKVVVQECAKYIAEFRNTIQAAQNRYHETLENLQVHILTYALMPNMHVFVRLDALCNLMLCAT
jgi:hypothetical protein